MDTVRPATTTVAASWQDLTVLPVSEVFGPTFQGEGPHTGRRTSFVRLGLCNLTCEWCDTPYTWDRTRYDVDKECPPTAIGVIHDQLREIDADTVCLSGGEPLIHRGKLRHLLIPEWTWHVETNGTLVPPDWWTELVAHTSVSPKVTTRDPESKRIKPQAMTAWNELAEAGHACFKFVCAVPRDLSSVDHLVATYGIDPANVWIMPEGTTSPEVVVRHRVLAPFILDRGYNTTTRLHSILYGQERGR